MSVSLEEMLSRPGIIELCFEWKKRDNSTSDLLCDIYDGRVWKKLSESYFATEESVLPLCLALNVDWFQPFKHTNILLEPCIFKHTQYSVGALYFSIVNLPTSLRFKYHASWIDSGPKEPPLTINSFLQPMVHDLLQLFHGVNNTLQGKVLQLRAIISLIACDIPATFGAFLGILLNIVVQSV